MTTYTDVFTASTIYPSELSYETLSLSADTTLYWPLDASDGEPLVAKIIDVTPSAAGYSITMPAATEASTGETILFNNLGSYTFTVKNNAGTVILTVAQSTQWQLYLASNTTAAGVWRSYQMGATTSTATAASLVGYGIKAITTTLNQKLVVATKSSNYTLVDADRSTLLNWTGAAGTLTLPSAAVVGDDWFCHIRNSGTASITVSGAQTIDDLVSKTFNIGDSAIVCCDGSEFFTVGFGQNATFAFDYTVVSIAGGVDYTLSGSELNRISYKFTGAVTADIDVIVPNTVQQYWIDDETTGGFTVSVKTSTQVTPMALTNGSRNIFYCDGSDVLNAVTSSLAPGAVVTGGSF